MLFCENEFVVRAFLEPPMAITPDRRRGIFAYDDMNSERSTLHVWNLSQPDQVTETHSPLVCTDKVSSIAVTSNGRYALSIGQSGLIMVWDLDRSVEVWTLTHQTGAWLVAIDAAGRKAVSAGMTVKIWDLNRGEEMRTLASGGRVRAIAITPEGREVVAGVTTHISGDDRFNEFRVWDIESGIVTSSVLYKDYLSWGNQAQDVAITPDGSRAVTAARDGRYVWRITIWDLLERRALGELDYGVGGRDMTVAISDDGTRVALASARNLKAWDLVTGTVESAAPWDSIYRAAAFTDGNRKVVATGDAGQNFMSIRILS